MPEVKLMTPLFDGGMYNRTGRRMRAVFIKEVADGTTTYRLWRKDGKPEIEYPRCDNDRYILHVEVNSYLIPLRMTEFQMIDNCGYPDIGAPNWEIIVAAAAEQIAGAGLILWTCREGELLENALEACARWGLHFDAVNDSLPSWKKFYGNDTRKVGATEYWDDKAYRVQNGKLMKEVAHEMD